MKPYQHPTSWLLGHRGREGQAGSTSIIPWLIASPGRSTLDRCAGSSGKG